MIVGTMRSAWVNSVLGANLKVVTTQTTSLAAATQVIEPKYITRAISVLTPGRDMSELGERANKYSRIIQARSFDMGALKAQGNIDKVNSFGEKAGYLIGWMDRRVCLSIFHAAEIKVAETQGFEIGSEENAKRAAKIADETIYTTQAMDSMAEKSALQRDTSEIAKLFSMFTSDTVKNLSHLYGNVMKYVAHKERAKTDASYEAELKKDAAEMKRSIRTLAVTGVMLGLITQAFKYIYGTEEEDEKKAADFALDIFGSTFNVLPVVSDVIDKLVFDYDLSLNVLDVANDTLEALREGFSTAGKAMRGEYVSAEDGTKVAADIIRSALSNAGLPVSPAEKTVMAVVRRLSPRAGYTWDDWSNNMSYTADLKAAVAKGDERLSEHVLGRLYRDQMTGDYSAEELEEVVRLYGAGYTGVLPQRIGEEVNGVKLDRAQRKRFNAIYAEASDKVDVMLRSDEYYALTDEQRAKAIKNLYGLYYAKAASEVTGKEWTNAQAYDQLIEDSTVLFIAQAYKSGLEAYKDASGKDVTVKEQFVDWARSLGLPEGEYAVVAYANGVKDKQTRADILKYINTLALSEEMKRLIAERLGFSVKNGAVVEADD
jgi:alkanesulfonate monooxygenase SsuD/methylene tetrahydromethanopterin reductase-like flavin-dependent oxidoreductase (luciferase family)